MPKLCGAERRKVRKQRRRNKDRRSLRERRLTDRQIDAFAWKMARIMSQGKVEDAGGHFFCPVCEMPYCVGYDGISVFCHECYYLPGCTKTTMPLRTCKECRK